MAEVDGNRKGLIIATVTLSVLVLALGYLLISRPKHTYTALVDPTGRISLKVAKGDKISFQVYSEDVQAGKSYSYKATHFPCVGTTSQKIEVIGGKTPYLCELDGTTFSLYGGEDIHDVMMSVTSCKGCLGGSGTASEDKIAKTGTSNALGNDADANLKGETYGGNRPIPIKCTAENQIDVPDKAEVIDEVFAWEFKSDPKASWTIKLIPDTQTMCKPDSKVFGPQSSVCSQAISGTYQYEVQACGKKTTRSLTVD